MSCATRSIAAAADGVANERSIIPIIPVSYFFPPRTPAPFKSNEAFATEHRTFFAMAPSLWNSLPTELRTALTLLEFQVEVFKKLLLLTEFSPTPTLLVVGFSTMLLAVLSSVSSFKF